MTTISILAPVRQLQLLSTPTRSCRDETEFEIEEIAHPVWILSKYVVILMNNAGSLEQDPVSSPQPSQVMSTPLFKQQT